MPGVSLLPPPKARRPSSSSLTEPLLSSRRGVRDGRIQDEHDRQMIIPEESSDVLTTTSTRTDNTKSFIEEYLGTDTQRGCFLLAATSVVYDIYTIVRVVLVVAKDGVWMDDLFIVYTVALTLISFGACKAYIASAPDRILSTAFYHHHNTTNKRASLSVHPPDDSSFWTIHLGTGLLKASQAQLLGSVIYLLSALVELIIVCCGIGGIRSSSAASSICSSIGNIIGGILIVTASYYNNIATYPENMLRPFDPQIVEYLEKKNRQWLIRHIGTDMQMAAWSWTLTSIIWFITSAIWFDYYHHQSSPSSSPLVNLICSVLLGMSSYYMLRQSYNEGTKFDTLLIHAFNNNNTTTTVLPSLNTNDDVKDKGCRMPTSMMSNGHDGDDDDIEAGRRPPSSLAAGADDDEHGSGYYPLHGVVDRQLVGLVDMDDVVKRSLHFLQDEDNWYCDGSCEEPVVHRLLTSNNLDNNNNAHDNTTHSIHDGNQPQEKQSCYNTDVATTVADDAGDTSLPPPPPPPSFKQQQQQQPPFIQPTAGAGAGDLETMTETTTIWKYRYGAAVKCSDILSGIQPLLVAAVLQSKTFKQSVIGDSEVGKVVVMDETDPKTFVYYERHPPDPPMPLSEFTYCSHLAALASTSSSSSQVDDDDVRSDTSESLVLVEWGVTHGQAQVDPRAARLDPYRVYWLQSLPGAKTKITTATYLSATTTTSAANAGRKAAAAAASLQLPSFLLAEELRKAPEIFADLKVFLSDESAMSQVIQDLEFRIWQDVHREITPLLTGVLVRASPAYRSMIASFPGLRARVPSSLPIINASRRRRRSQQQEEGGDRVEHDDDDENPLSFMPSSLSQAITDDGILEACSAASVFLSNEFEDWTLTSTTTRSATTTTTSSSSFIHNPFKSSNTTASSSTAAFKLTTWRRKLNREVIDPYRITCKAQGIDPLTLATIWQDPNFRANPQHHTCIESILDVSHDTNDVPRGVRVFMEQLKGHGTMRKREAGVVSIMKEISATKVMVVDYSLPPPEVARYMTTHTTTTKSSVHVNVFNVALFENDAGANTKITLAGLVPVGGKTEKFGLKLMAEREVKAQQQFMTFIYNYFSDTSEGRSWVTKTRTRILGEVWKPVLSSGNLSELQLQFLRANSDAFNMLLNEEDHINNNNNNNTTSSRNLSDKSESASRIANATRKSVLVSSSSSTTNDIAGPRKIRSSRHRSVPDQQPSTAGGAGVTSAAAATEGDRKCKVM